MSARVLVDGPDARAAAIEAIRAGALVALPTDTVYGVAVALDAPDGLSRLFLAKERPLDKGIVLLVDSLEQAASVGIVDRAAAALAATFWPGGLTLVLAQRPGAGLPPELTGGASTIGVRQPDHPTPRELARAVGPLPTSSANRSGWPDATDAAAVLAQLGDRVEIVLDGGPARGGIPSSVVRCAGGPATLLRAGAIRVERLAAALEAAGLPHELTPAESQESPRG